MNQRNDTGQNERLMKLATACSVATASALIIVKVIAWYMTDSISVLATLLDSFMDLLASVITLFAVRIALIPADKEHRFGHGKAEGLAVLAQSAFICGSAMILLFSVLDNLTNRGSELNNERAGMIVILFSVVATLLLLAIQSYVVKKTGSTAIAADSTHYKVDLMTNISVGIALFGASYGYHYLDPVCALLIVLYMLFSVGRMAWDAIQELMDHSMPEEDIDKIVQIAMTIEGVRTAHDLRTRQSAQTSFIEIHLSLDGHQSLKEAHTIGQGVKEAIMAFKPSADVIAHLEPINHRV